MTCSNWDLIAALKSVSLALYDVNSITGKVNLTVAFCNPNVESVEIVFSNIRSPHLLLLV